MLTSTGYTGIVCAGVVVIAVHGCSGNADAACTNIVQGAGIAVAAGCSISGRGVGACACCWITGARHMALIGGGANYRCAAAGAIGAHITGRARIAVIAGCSISGRWVAAYAAAAGACNMALIGSGADDRCSDADAVSVTSVARGACIVVIAGCSGRGRWVAAYAAAAGARHMALIGGGANYRCAAADAAAVTNVVRGACIVVIAACSSRLR